MWDWEQGRLSYFQFDSLKVMARLALAHDWKSVEKSVAVPETGLQFPPDQKGYEKPWRNYARVLRLCMIVYEDDSKAVPTPLAELLAGDGLVTSDEYFHFIAQTFTDPSPALVGEEKGKKAEYWDPTIPRRYPLAFALRYGLVKLAETGVQTVALDEVLYAYSESEISGGEDYSQFVALVTANQAADRSTLPSSATRQARESLYVVSQISYLHYDGKALVFSLDARDARQVFDQLRPINGTPEREAQRELSRLANLFDFTKAPQTHDLKSAITFETQSSGFREGTKTTRSHITIERNPRLRDAYFSENPTAICDACEMDTSRRYPWAARILDLHHLLPLSSGTRVLDSSGTMLCDLAPLCPTCHRAVHRYYDRWLRDESRADFESMGQAREVYGVAKTRIGEAAHAQ